jgi:hypothetical protein
MKLGKIISLLIVIHFCLTVANQYMYSIHSNSRLIVVDLSYYVLTYLTIPLIAIWFYKSTGNKKGTI